MFFDSDSRSLQSLYVHIPFCFNKCSYCDFFSLPGQSHDIVKSIIDKTIMQADFLRQKYNIENLKTLYIGGGTPTFLSPIMLEYLVNSILSQYPRIPEEITIEVNPENFSSEYLQLFSIIPVTRISLGIQTFNSRYLSLIGRNCSAVKNLAALDMIKKLDKIELNIDIISSLPEQKISEALHDIKSADMFDPDHISLYSLTLEKNTPLSMKYTYRDIDENCWLEASDYLHNSGYRHYEISNYAKNNSISVHNMNYWRMKPYAGCGMTAVSNIITEHSVYRLTGTDNIKSFLSGMDDNWGSETENISDRDYLIETVMMGTRTDEGIDLNKINNIFNIDAESLFSSAIQRWMNKKMLYISDNFLFLTRGGRFFHSSFMIDIISDIDNQKTYFT